MTMPIEAGRTYPKLLPGTLERFTDGVIAAVSEDKPFDEDKFHQDITQFEYNWTLQKDSFPIVSEEDPIQIADSLILKYDTYFTKAQ